MSKRMPPPGHDGSVPDSLVDDLRSQLGVEHVLTDELTAGFERDWTGQFGGSATAVVRPGDLATVEAVVGTCRRHGAALIPQGGNTGLVGGSVPRRGSDARVDRAQVVLSTVRLDAIEPLDDVTGQITVGAGVTLAALQGALRGTGWRFGVDLGARDRATVGGMVATNAGGLRVLAHGMMRRQIVGLEAALADGRSLSRLDGLVKDNTGYDLAGLICGSEGTLAIVTAVRLRLIPEPIDRVVALLGVNSIADAAAVGAHVRRGAGVEAVELLTAETAELAAAYGALARPFRTWPPAMVLVESTGTEPAGPLGRLIEDRTEVGEVAVATTPSARRDLWALRELITDALASVGPVLKLDITVPGAGIPIFVEALGCAVADRAPLSRLWLFGHLADGNLHVNVTDHDPSANRELTDAILGLVSEHHGSISAEHGIGVAKREWLHLSRDADERATMAAIKAALDPSDILNPGVLFAQSRQRPRLR